LRIASRKCNEKYRRFNTMTGATYDYNPFIYRVYNKKTKLAVGTSYLSRESYRAIEHAKYLNARSETKNYYVGAAQKGKKVKTVWKP